MLTMEEKIRIMNMTPEERRADLLDSTSDQVRSIAKQLAMMKAIAHVESGLDPEDFDRALDRELKKAWDKVKDKNGHELAVLALLEMATNGVDPAEILGGE